MDNEAKVVLVLTPNEAKTLFNILSEWELASFDAKQNEAEWKTEGDICKKLDEAEGTAVMAKQGNGGYYSRPVVMPKNIQEGTANCIQMIINQLERGEPTEALYAAVDLLDQLIGPKPGLVVSRRTKRGPNY